MKRYIVLWMVAFGICSCESFLDVQPKSEVLGDKLYESAEGFEDALYGVYTGLGQEELYGKALSWYLPDLLAGYYLKEGIMNSQEEYLLTFKYTDSYFSGRSQFDRIWTKMYENISYVNDVIRNLNEKGMGFRYSNFYKGEALALRAFMHFELCSNFAPAYREETQDKPAIPYSEAYAPLVFPFRSVGEIYRKVIEDLKEAESLLADEPDFLNLARQDQPGVSAFMTNRQFHMNLYAVEGLLARVYCMKNDLDSAMIYADKVIRSGCFQFADKTGLGYEYASCISKDETLWGVYPKSDWEKALRDSYDYQSDNPEEALLPLNGFFVYPDWMPEGMMPVDYGYRAMYAVNTSGGQQDYRMNWFRQRTGVTGAHGRFYKIYNNTETLKGQKGINMMRIPEMYLIMAEALLKKGNTEEAREYFDTYTNARGFVYKDEDAVFDMNLINKEYRKEFIGEGRTWYNMKRQNLSVPQCMFPAGDTRGSDEIYTWPVPEKEFEYREGGKEGVYPPEEDDVEQN